MNLSTVKALARDLFDFSLVRLGLSQTETRLNQDAQRHWDDTRADRWRSHSHWRDGGPYEDATAWRDIGAGHLELYRRLAGDRPLGRVVEWGCGGGANAVAFAPHATEFVGVDISEASVEECGRRVAEVCATPYVPVVASVDNPEDAGRRIGECDLYLSLYVLELVTTPEYGLRLMRIARDILAPGGQALVQIKYDIGSWRTRSRRRRYRSSTAAGMTSYRIDEFWSAVEEVGFRPEVVSLVPENDLDERYAYFLLTKVG